MAIPTIPPPSERALDIGKRVREFLDEHIIPAEPIYERQLAEGGDRWASPPIMKRSWPARLSTLPSSARQAST